MPKTSSVARREFVATVTTKGFLFGVVIFPLIVVAAMPLIMALIKHASPTVTGSVVVIDRSGALTDLQRRVEEHSPRERVKEQMAKLPPVPGASAESITASMPDQTITVKVDQNGADLDALKKSLYETAKSKQPRLAVVVVPKGAVEPPAGDGSDRAASPAKADGAGTPGSGASRSPYEGIQAFVAPGLDPEIQDQITSAVEEAVVDARIRHDPRVADAGLTPEQIQTLIARPHADVKTVTPEGERNTFAGLAFILPVAFMFLLWISVFTAGQFLLYSTIEEKSSRVMEVLLSAVSPMQLMVGKITGQLGVAAVVLAVYAGVGLAGLAAFAAMHLVHWTDLGLLVVYFVLAFFMIACLMAAVGSAVNDVKEAGALMGPINLVLFIPLLLWMPISRDPNSVLSQVLSFVPPISPFVMVVRISGSEQIPLWQIPATIVVGAAGAVFFAWATAKIFRIGALMYGKPPNLRTLIRWVRMA